MFSDYHIHSRFSSDSDEEPEKIIQKAIELNMHSICFTDHIDHGYPVPPDEPWLTFSLDIPAYTSFISKMHDKYNGKIRISTGIEIGITPDNYRANQLTQASHPFDFIIASTHIIENSDPYYKEFWENKNIHNCLTTYFENTLSSIKSFSDFDVCGHLDYLTRYVPDKSFTFTYKDYSDIIDEILILLIKNDKGIEINTAGYRNHTHMPNPCPDIIKRYHELGGRIITIGSDAHKVSDIGSNFDKMYDLLTSCGFDSYYTFENRKPVEHQLEASRSILC